MKRKAFLFPGTVSPHLRSFPPPISAREKWREKCLQSEKLPHRPTSETRKLKRAVNQIDLCYTGGISDKEPACQCRRRVQSLGREDPLEEGMAAHSRILAWEIPWTEEPGGLQSMLDIISATESSQICKCLSSKCLKHFSSFF